VPKSVLSHELPHTGRELRGATVDECNEMAPLIAALLVPPNLKSPTLNRLSKTCHSETGESERTGVRNSLFHVIPPNRIASTVGLTATEIKHHLTMSVTDRIR